MPNNSSSKQELAGSNTIIEEKIIKLGSDPIIRKYVQGKFLGKGGFAKCYEVTNMENKKVMAAKIISKATLAKSRAKQKLISEIKIHKSLRHNNVVGFEHVFEDQDNVYILLELCTNQSMYELVKKRKRLTEIEVQCYVMQLVNGLKYLHGRKVIHRDLKLGNLFLNDKMELKMGDFGLAAKVEFDGEKKRTVCGTPNYIAPEIIEGKGGHSYEVDTWSLGVIIYTLLVGRPPFETADVKLTYKKIKACSYSFPDHISVSDNAKNLIGKMLNLEPSKRPSLEEIIQHPFMKGGNNIPKTLPVSTLSCPPSSSYMNQFVSQDNIAKIIIQPHLLAETAPLADAKNEKAANNQKAVLANTEKVTINSSQPSSTQAQTNENSSTVPTMTRLSSRGENKGWTLTKPGTIQTSGISSLTNLRSSLRPQTVQQGDLRSPTGIKTVQSIGSLGNRLRISGRGFSGTIRTKPGNTVSNEIYVKKWVDYSSKYGMGYILSNGATGVFFNDDTKIVLHPKGEKFDYIHKNKDEKQDSVASYTLTEYPKDLQKKVMLLHHFRTYLEGDDKIDSAADNEAIGHDQIYVKKWIKTKNATMFRLSNKVVQMNFADKTELILNSDVKVVTYVNKKGERNNYPMATAMESSNTEMTKRLKFTKELLSTMLTGQQLNQVPTLNLL